MDLLLRDVRRHDDRRPAGFRHQAPDLGTTVSLQPLSGHVVARVLRARAVTAGLDGTPITDHSLRAGHASTAAPACVHLHRIAAQTRHKDLTVFVNRYIRPFEAPATTSSKDIGLVETLEREESLHATPPPATSSGRHERGEKTHPR
jgi:hypothetical protein